jgi:hypothetical protein
MTSPSLLNDGLDSVKSPMSLRGFNGACCELPACDETGTFADVLSPCPGIDIIFGAKYQTGMHVGLVGFALGLLEL